MLHQRHLYSQCLKYDDDPLLRVEVFEEFCEDIFKYVECDNFNRHMYVSWINEAEAL